MRVSITGSTLLLSCAVTLALCAAAPGATHELRGFHHSSWTSENGLGAVKYLHQGTDGYLWLTTSRGVFRFDGIRFESIDDASNGLVTNKEIDSAFPAKSGGLWLSTQKQGMVYWTGDQLKPFPDRRCTPARGDGRVVEASDGSLWIRSSAGLGHLQDGNCTMAGPESGYPGGFAKEILVDSRGALWVKVPSGEMLRMPAGSVRFEVSPSGKGETTDLIYMHEAPDGVVWLSDAVGLRAISNRAGLPLTTLPVQLRNQERFGNFTFAPDGTLWASNKDGIVRFASAAAVANGAGLDSRNGASFTMSQGLSADVVWALLVDREGSVWMGTNSGLDQLRATALTSIPLPPHPEHQMVVAAGDAGSVWVGSRGLPLTHITADGVMNTFPETRQSLALRRDFRGDLWSGGTGASGLWRIHKSSITAVHYPAEKVEPAAAIALDRNGELWINTTGPHVYHRNAEGHWNRMDQVVGRKPGIFGAMAGDPHGNVWFAFSNKVVQWDGKEFHRYEFPPIGPLNISVAVLGFRDDRVWMGGMSGIILFRHGQFRRLCWQDENVIGRTFAVIETKAGELWLNGSSGIVRVSAPELSRWLADANHCVAAERFDAKDGVIGLSGDRVPDPSAIEAPDGRLWFATTKAVMWIDPTALKRNRNRLPPPIYVTSMTGDGIRHLAPLAANLPARTDNLQFDYTALSLAVPERVKFRYKLEGKETQWNEAGTRRQAFYNSLAPGHYRFLVSASNNDGVWNVEPAAFALYLAPAFYQSWWFFWTCALAAAITFWLLLRLRVIAITRRLEANLTVRLEERERIARELHDTLLQSLFALMMRFRLATSELPAVHPLRTSLTDALDQADRAMAEGRARVKDLRTRPGETLDLAEELICIGHQLKTLSSAEFAFSESGTRRPLTETVHTEAVLMAREAMMNAYKHSDGDLVKVHLAFTPVRLILSIEDNGQGIDLAILERGYREQHWGLPGMKERMRKLGAEFDIQCPPSGGTRVRVEIPAGLAYVAPGLSLGQLFSRPHKGMSERF